MTYSKTITYETGSNGDAATTANTNSDTPRFTTSAGTATISTAEHHSGTRSMHWVGLSGSGLWCVEDTLGALSTFSRDIYVKMPTLPSAETTIALLLDSALARQASLAINNLGAVVIRDAAGGLVYASPSGKRLTASATAWYRIKWDAAYGTAGTQQVRWFADGASTATDDSLVKPSDNGSNLFAFLRRGSKALTTTATSDFYFDDESQSGTNPVVANAGPDQSNIEPWTTIHLDASASTGTTFAWVQTAGPAVTLTGANTATPTCIAPGTITGATLTFQVTVDGSATDAVSAGVMPVTERLVVNGVEVPARLFVVSSS